jgi:hypothetical protein
MYGDVAAIAAIKPEVRLYKYYCFSMLNQRTATGQISWLLLWAVLAAQFAVLCLAWVSTSSNLLQGVLLIACLFPLRALSVRAAGRHPFPTLTASEAKQRELLLIVGFFILLFGLGADLGHVLKSLGLYPGPYAVIYLAAWVPLAIAWNLLGYQR